MFTSSSSSSSSTPFSPSSSGPSTDGHHLHHRSSSYSSDLLHYDFESEDNFEKWKPLCMTSLRKIQLQVHPTIEATEEALLYVESLILRLLKSVICCGHHSVADIEGQVLKTFPPPLDKWAPKHGHTVVGDLFPGSKKNSKKAFNTSRISFPVQEFHSLLVKELLGSRSEKRSDKPKVSLEVTTFIIAILEYIASDLFKLVGNYVRNMKHQKLTKLDIKIAMNADKVLMDLFYPDNDGENEMPVGGNHSDSRMSLESGADGNERQLTYDEYVKEVIHEEKQFIRDLCLITKVFREPFERLLRQQEESSSCSLPSTPTSLMTNLSSFTSSSGQWSAPSSPTHKSPSILTQKDIDIVFSNVIDIHELSVNLLCSLEDALEATSDEGDAGAGTGSGGGVSPKGGAESIGACFEEMAESVEFDVFEKFAQDILGNPSNGSPAFSPSIDRLNQLLADQRIINSLSTGGSGFLLAVKYVLPKLLNGVVYHCFSYFDYIRILKQLSPSGEDRESFSQAEGLLQPLRNQLEKLTSRKPGIFGENYLRLHSSENRRNSATTSCNSSKKIQEIVKSIDGVEASNQFCNEFIREGTLGKLSGGKRDPRSSERQVFLFDGLLLLCKSNSSKRSSSIQTHGHSHEFRLKERFFIRKIEVIDHSESSEPCPPSEDATLSLTSGPSWSLMNASSWGSSTTSLASTMASSLSTHPVHPYPVAAKYCFEICSQQQQQNVVLFANTQEEKTIWMANLIMLSTKTMLERTLDSILSDEEKKNPLQLPSPACYRFAERDSEENILFEELKFNKPVGVPLIKGATLVKLIERLTYHQHADPMFVKIFLTTYRSFCSPQELLDLLVERFDIPEIESSSREDVKRFRKEYCQPVQFRVLNVIRHWVDQHYYDFARDPVLLQKLISFLEDKVAKNMRNMKKWVDSILKTINRKKDFPVTSSSCCPASSITSSSSTRANIFTFNGIPPAIEWYLTKTPEEFSLLTLHPIEFGRQLTLLEFELFRAVKPSELVGCAWTKKDKEKTSSNLLKMIHFSTNFTYWLEKQVIETENFEERVALVSRMIEVMLVLLELNNFNGVLEMVSAYNSAAVYRLEHTTSSINVKLKKALDEACELNSEHSKKYQEQLRSINPPCVPFLGMYLTNIVHIEEGNCDAIQVPSGSNGAQASLINLSKRRKVAEITGEIQQYQNQPYCLNVHQDIRAFFESLNPLEGLTEKEFNDYLYAKSLEIEPRQAKQPAKFPRKWPDLPLKSPGIKPTSFASTMSSTLSRAKHHFSSSNDQENKAYGTGAGAGTGPPVNQDQPHSPLTPLTPPPLSSGSVSDHSVFATIAIGGCHPQTPVQSSTPPTPCPFPGPSSCPSAPPMPLTPPPLPPRTRNRQSRVPSTTSDREDSPPPLPPRGVNAQPCSRYGHLMRSNQAALPIPPLPLSQPQTQAPTPSHPASTLIRRNSALETPSVPQLTARRHSQSMSLSLPQASQAGTGCPGHPPPPPPMAMASSGPPSALSSSSSPEGIIPQLPPRTYRTSQQLLLK